nr:vegetative cell wall protein gp1-like [Aegilops tauschii subsp. strangulata]
MAPPASMATPSPSASAASPHPAVLHRRRTRAVLCFLYGDKEPPRPRVSSTSSLQRPRGAELLPFPMVADSPAPSFPAAGVQVPRPMTSLHLAPLLMACNQPPPPPSSPPFPVVPSLDFTPNDAATSPLAMPLPSCTVVRCTPRPPPWSLTSTTTTRVRLCRFAKYPTGKTDA